MAKISRDNAKLGLFLLGVLGVAIIAKPAPQVARPAPVYVPEHTCSGVMDRALKGTVNEAEQRRIMCDEGGEKALTDMFNAEQERRRKPAT